MLFKNFPKLKIKFQLVELFPISCHSEPVRTLAWESPGLEGKCHIKQPEKLGDCHTSDIGHWFAMTRINPNLLLLCKKCRGEPRHFHFGKEISQRRRRTARTDRRPRQWCCSCYPWRCINRRTGRRSPCTRSCRDPWWCRSCRFWWRTSSQYRQQQRSRSCSQRRRCKRWRQQPRKRR